MVINRKSSTTLNDKKSRRHVYLTRHHGYPRGLACGVPVVAFPQWTDQMTNAKQIEDVWKSGVRVNVNEDGVVESEEMRREAVKEGGSSHKNLKAFIEEVAKKDSWFWTVKRPSVEDRAKQGCPFKRIIYLTLTAWSRYVGQEHKRSIDTLWFLWIQPATVLDIYYYFFNGYEDSIKNCSKDQSLGKQTAFILLDKVEIKQKVLVNTFDALEFDALKDFGDYMDYLDSKAKESVVYVAFGSYSQIPNQLMEEIAQGLVLCKRPFLWVIREGEWRKAFEKLSCKEELEELGKTVSWCSQVGVLQHPSLACFLSSLCGWNSSMETYSRVPLVACPIWTDQL
ncbi:hypothetical protein HAX54_029365 [Datura stramonium]|uniref:Uncharacterized protein n=1 Tax=Datura stramonium TaxID=4076 RepID=A0ABS8V5T3_DATST|nr:hypothetical protein [Datura stramonium]